MLPSAVFSGRNYWISRKLAYVLFAAVGIFGLVVIYAIDPRNPGSYPLCPFLGLTGYHCPGCGTLRALHQLCHGQLVSAVGYNPLTIASLPFIAYSYVYGLTKAFRFSPIPTIFIPHRWIWALFVGVVSFWIRRNIPVEPLTALAP